MSDKEKIKWRLINCNSQELLADRILELQDKIEQVRKDLIKTKRNNTKWDNYGNTLIYIDKQHIDYLLEILK